MTGILMELVHRFGALGVGAGAALEGEAAVTLGGVLALLAAIYLLEVRHKYKSPEWAREQAARNGAAGA